MRPKPNVLRDDCIEFYRALMPALRHVANRCGYALAVHGSLSRDIDIVAAPWREGAISAESLISHIRQVVKAVTGQAKLGRGVQPEPKPNGRLAWSILLTHDKRGAYLDISVMPIGVVKK